MSDKLEEFFDQHQKEFGEATPDPGHEERFAAKLLSQEPVTPKLLISWKWVASVAVLVGIGIATWLFYPATISQNQPIAESVDSTMSLGELSPEYADVEVYYRQQLAERMTKVKRLDNVQEKDMSALTKSLDELEIYYQSLQVDLEAQPGNKLIISSMIQNYRLRVMILEQLIEEMEQSLHKQSNYEMLES